MPVIDDRPAVPWRCKCGNAPLEIIVKPRTYTPEQWAWMKTINDLVDRSDPRFCYWSYDRLVSLALGGPRCWQDLTPEELSAVVTYYRTALASAGQEGAD